MHSLPNAKRYPASGWDYSELLRRHNVVASHVLGDSSPCALLLTGPCRARTPEELTKLAMLVGNGVRYVAELPSDLWDDRVGVFTEPMCVFGAAVHWNAGAFDGFICAVADERLEGLVVALSHGQVYAPYDGGADLFFTTETERDLAQQRYGTWLSSRADGL